jgi:DNA (cytosine-5)-methyltransferase 1
MEDKALDEAPVWSNLKTFDGKPWRGLVDTIIGGYPCQPFSLAGLRKGADDPRHLWPYIAQIIRDVQPRECFFENVSGHLSLGFREVRSELESMGYRVTPGLFTAAEVGATHKRERLFILAQSGDFGPSLRERSNDSSFRHRYVANPPGSRFERWRSGAGQSFRDFARWAAGESGKRIGALADAHQPGLEGQYIGLSDTQGWQESPGPIGLCNRTGLAYPPGPGDHAQWVRVLAEYPWLAPATSNEEEAKFSLRGMVNGLAERVEQLRAIGNGVVPDVAALAYRTLSAESSLV